MSTAGPGRAQVPRHRRALRVVVGAVTVLVLVLATGLYVGYRHLEGNITALDTAKALGTDRPEAWAPTQDVPHDPLNILLLGSDTREGQGNGIGGETPGLSDSTILLHLSADRTRAYGVSLPRDAMVERPSCLRKDGQGTDPGGLSMFNAAYAVGGPGCTQRTVEQLTGIRIDHFVVIDFAGFKEMVDALGGVPVCVPSEVHDDVGHIHLPAGTYEANGAQALDYVRVRHAISANGDIGRMKRQQAFLGAMATKAISAGTLSNPVRLYSFLDAATKSLTTDPALANLRDLTRLARELRGIGPDDIQFLTVPFQTYDPDPNRLEWSPLADRLWDRLRSDTPLSRQQRRSVTSAAESSAPAPESGRDGLDGGGSARQAGVSARQTEAARENGLCA